MYKWITHTENLILTNRKILTNVCNLFNNMYIDITTNKYAIGVVSLSLHNEYCLGYIDFMNVDDNMLNSIKTIIDELSTEKIIENIEGREDLINPIINHMLDIVCVKGIDHFRFQRG